MLNISEYLSREEIAGFSQRSNWRALRMFLLNWGAVLLVFWFATTWPNPLSLLAAVMLLAGRQLGLAVLMHECGHNTLFPSRRLNRWCGQWLAAAPTFADLNKYASGHNGHHQWVGTAEDPDLSNYRAYPVSRASFKRKMQRDLTGKTGYKLMRKRKINPTPALRQNLCASGVGIPLPLTDQENLGYDLIRKGWENGSQRLTRRAVEISRARIIGQIRESGYVERKGDRDVP